MIVDEVQCELRFFFFSPSSPLAAHLDFVLIYNKKTTTVLSSLWIRTGMAHLWIQVTLQPMAQDRRALMI
jgi:hypothetical protein